MNRTVRAAAALAAALFACGATASAGTTLVPVTEPAITVLLLHQVTAGTPFVSPIAGEDQVKQPWVTPQALDVALSDAEAAGFRVVDLETALGYLSGTVPAHLMPAKALLLTFDDGYASAWTEATPVLRKHRATATMFFEGQLTDTKPGRLTSAELKAMAASGVWRLECHGWAGHANVVIDAAGTRNAYWYANLAWLPDKGRRETIEEYRARIRADVHRFRTTFEPVVGAPIRVFAYPSGEFGQNGPLAPGGDPRAKLEAGHSDANGLRPVLEAALKDEGFTAAFAVSIPGDVAPASRVNDPFAIPRLGVGATFSFAAVRALQADGAPLPEIVDDRFTDPGPLARTRDGFVLGATSADVIYRLDDDARVRASARVPALLDDRSGHPPLVSAVVDGGDGTTTILQQAGFWPQATPRLTVLRWNGDGATAVERRALPAACNWTVGAARVDGSIVAMTDDGTLLAVPDCRPLGKVGLLEPAASRQNRFAGPAVAAGALRVYDRVAHQLLTIDGIGNVLDHVPLAGDFVALAGDARALYAVDKADKRHLLRRFSIGS